MIGVTKLKIRLKTSIQRDVALMMVSFGIVIGIIFPFFVYFMGMGNELVLNPRFFIYCIVAGILVAMVNIFIVNTIVIKKIQHLSCTMKELEFRLNKRSQDREYVFQAEKFLLSGDSDDALGDSIRSFNNLATSLANALKFESDVFNFTTMLSLSMEVELLSCKALQMLKEFLTADGGLLIYQRDCQLVVGAENGITTSPCILTNNFVLETMKEGKAKIIKPFENDAAVGMNYGSPHHSMIIYPINYKERTLGAIALFREHLFCDRDIEKLQIFCSNLGIALENSITHEKLQNLATIDTLTGLHNRHYGMLRLNEETCRAVRDNTSIGVLMFDIDNFKIINDCYGHIAGDHALIHVAKLIKNSIRQSDTVARYGGEEFMCILSGADHHACLRIAESIRNKVMECNFRYNDIDIPITISGGITVAQLNEKAEIESLINEADSALYQAKSLGRNRVISYSSHYN